MQAAGDEETQTLALFDDGRSPTSVRQSATVELLLRYGHPRAAAGVAFFGLGAGSIPLLYCRPREGALTGTASVDNPGPTSRFRYLSKEGGAGKGENVEASGLFNTEELKTRLGAIDPATAIEELELDPMEVCQRASASNTSDEILGAEVRDLQKWNDQAQASVALLEKRSALAYLGLDADAEPEAVQKSYKQKALAVHPDKGGNEEEFQELQEMVARIQEAEDDDNSKTSNLFTDLAKKCKEAKEAETEANLDESVRLRRQRILLNEKALDLWQRTQEAERQLEAAAIGSRSRGLPVFEKLRDLVANFVSEMRCLPRGVHCRICAERLLCKFVRQGLEILTVAALLDPMKVVAEVSLGLTGPLLRITRGFGPCASLENRCQSFLQGLAQVKTSFDALLAHLQERLENKAAAEWRGCVAQAVDAPKTDLRTPVPEVHKPKDEEKGKCPFEAAVVKASADPNSFKNGAAESATKTVASTGIAAEALSVRRSDDQREFSLQRQRGRLRDTDLETYQTSGEWRKLRAACIRGRFCVDFNRDSKDLRCRFGADDCGYTHACVICGARETGGPQAQYMHHGGWNCAKFDSWLMVHQ